MLGKHCLKTWCGTQGALALSSAEAEYYSMVEGVLRAMGMKNVGRAIGLDGVDSEMILATESSAAKGFVSRRRGWKDETYGGEVVVVTRGSSQRKSCHEEDLW